MIAKRSLVFLFGIILLSSVVLAQVSKIEIEIKETFKANEVIIFKINLYDSENRLIEDDVSITLEDVIEKNRKIEKIIPSKELTSINLGKDSIAGDWRIIAKSQDIEKTEYFKISINEEAEFKLEEDKLIITNNGNAKYEEKIKIFIGDTEGEKELSLNIGESISYRLIAPKGAYNIKVVDDEGKTVLFKPSVPLTGKGLTGEVIGAIDEKTQNRNPLTGGISPSADSDEALFSYLRGSRFVYVFVLVVFGAMILLAIERRYRKKVSK